MRSENYSPGLSSGYVLDVSKGGTGKDNRSDAIAELDAIPREVVGVPQGVVGFLPGTRFIPESLVPPTVGVTSMVNLSGPTDARLLETIELFISNYDSFTTYDVTTTDCSALVLGDKIQVTLDVAVPVAKVTVNGSVYPIQLKTASDILPHTQELVLPIVAVTAKNMTASPNGEYILVSDPDRSKDGVPLSGLVGLFRRQGNILGAPSLFDHSQLDVSFAYSGKGTKKINNVSTVTDGSLTLKGLASITVDGTGTVEEVGAVAEQGNSAYLEGLPPYKAPVFQYTATGTTIDQNPASETFGVGFTVTVQASSWDVSGSLVNPKLFVNNGGAESLSFVATDFSLPDVEAAFWTGEIENLPVGYLSPRLKTTLTLVKQQVSAQEGLAIYPQGLPVYVPYSPGQTVAHSVTIASNYMGAITGEQISLVLEPFKNLKLGKTLAVANNGNIAYSGASLIDGQVHRSPRVIFQLYSGNSHLTQDICPSNLGPLSTFGEKIAITADGSILFVSDAAYDCVYMFSLNSVSGKMEQRKVVRGTTGSGFGSHLSLATDQNTLGVGIPNVGGQGSIRLFGFDDTSMTVIGELTPAGGVNGNNFALNFKVVQSQFVLASNSQAGALRRVTAFRRTAGVWNIEFNFLGQNAGSYTGFADSYACNAEGTVLSIGYSGSPSERGSVENWVRFNGAWSYVGNKLASAGTIGDGFGSLVAMAGDTSSLLSVRKDTAQTSVFI